MACKIHQSKLKTYGSDRKILLDRPNPSPPSLLTVVSGQHLLVEADPLPRRRSTKPSGSLRSALLKNGTRIGSRIGTSPPNGPETASSTVRGLLALCPWTLRYGLRNEVREIRIFIGDSWFGLEPVARWNEYQEVARSIRVISTNKIFSVLERWPAADAVTPTDHESYRGRTA